MLHRLSLLVVWLSLAVAAQAPVEGTLTTYYVENSHNYVQLGTNQLYEVNAAQLKAFREKRLGSKWRLYTKPGEGNYPLVASAIFVGLDPPVSDGMAFVREQIKRSEQSLFKQFHEHLSGDALQGISAGSERIPWDQVWMSGSFSGRKITAHATTWVQVRVLCYRANPCGCPHPKPYITDFTVEHLKGAWVITSGGIREWDKDWWLKG